ncbi:MAG: sugar transporter substrate-binding protein [Clostridia bacterium]|nr:sugar transporter substrate-binding protein [Clostridia bacterium]
MKKISLLLLICLMAGIFTACNDSITEEKLDAEGNAVVDAEYRDFGGQEFIHSAPGAGWEMFWPEEAVSAKNDRIRAKSKAVQEALNCVFTEEALGGDNSDYYQKLIAAGDYHINFASERGVPNCIFSMYKAGLIEYLDDIEAIDFNNTEVWGTPEKRMPFTYENKVWAYSGGGNEGGTYGRLLYNNDLIKEFGVESPQSLYEQKKWTFDTFKELLPLVTDTTPERRIYGLSLYPINHMLELTAIFANGGNVVKKDSSGKAYFGLLDNEALDAMEWVKEIKANKDSVRQDVWKPTLFGSKGSTFFLTMVFVGIESDPEDDIMYPQNHLDDFAWIPFPSGPDAEYGKYTGTYESDFGGTVILIGNDKQDEGYVLNEFLSYIMKDEEGNIVNEEASFKRNFFHSEESYDNYKKGSINFSYDYYPQLKDSYRNLIASLIKISSGRATPVEALEAIKDSMNAEIDININGIKE